MNDIEAQLMDVSRLAVLIWNDIDMKKSEYRVKRVSELALGVHKALEENGEIGGALEYDIIAAVAKLGYDYLTAPSHHWSTPELSQQSYEITVARLALNRITASTQP